MGATSILVSSMVIRQRGDRMVVRVKYSTARWLNINLKNLAIRSLGLAVMVLPFKLLTIGFLGHILGIISFFLNMAEWNAIARFRRQIHSSVPRVPFLLKHYLQHGKDSLWSNLYFEARPLYDRYITIEGAPLVKAAIANGNGVIILGAHNGPALISVLFQRLSSNVKHLVAQSWSDYIERVKKWGVPILIRRRTAFQLSRPEDYPVHLKAEKSLVRHCRAGGILNMVIDRPPPRGGVSVEMLGEATTISAFPFKLSLKHDIPTFFYYYRNIKNGGYQLCFQFIEQFSNPEEGISMYLEMLQKQVLDYPYMWDHRFHDVVRSDSMSALDGVSAIPAGKPGESAP